ncbi:hypothetical protein FDENT_1576 [Fusarium denticulatum]|uniref:Myb-like domain-containing protein n=1 Tax=Fusarium denticulatum TaxID=48507 RepID=A0A8H6CVR2_9HYPO|nr:hypothetical protein FDENT_1576 [Fusarium denticulatum]
MQRFPIPPPTWAAYKQNQEYYDRLYQGLSGSWYNHNTVVPGFVELPGHCVHRPPVVNQAASSRADPNPNNPTMHCDKQLGKVCHKACCKLKPKARGRRVTIATASDEENGVVTDTEGNITDSSNPVVKSKMTKAKGKDKAVQTESENESSAGETSVLSSVAYLKDRKWSLSEDCRLRSMKEAGETWDFISGSLCKTKDDVRARWKILQSQLLAKDTTKDTDNAAEEGSVDDTTDEYGGDDEESAEGDEDSDADDEDSDDDEESDEEDEDPNDDEDSDDDEESDESDESDEDSDDDTNKIPKMKHLQEHVYGAMYPPHIYPQPNAHLVKRDCALLATIDSKYKRSRWLEMQANFYNVTGQMVPLVSFKARFERAEAEKTERSKTRELEKRLNKVEDWIAKQEREKSADSESSEDSNDTEDSDDSDE